VARSPSPDRTLDIAAIAGALGFEPGNASHEGELIALLRAGLGAGRGRMRSPSQMQVRSLLAAHSGPRWGASQTLFTSRIPFHGGDHLVLTGGYEGLDAAVEDLVASLLRHKQPPPDALVRDAFRMTAAVLRLSHHAVRTARLSRHESCAESDEVLVPATPELRRLLKAVVFTRDELDAITGVGAIALEPLVTDVGDIEPPADGVGPFGITPILRHGERYVLAAPSCLLLALRHHLVLLAKRHRWGGALAERLLRNGAQRVDAALGRIGWEKTRWVPRPDPTLPVTEQLWVFDDGAALVTIVGDDLSDYRADDPEATWNAFYRYRDAISVRRDMLAGDLWLGEAEQLPRKLLHLVVRAGVGRPEVWMDEHATEPLLIPEVSFAIADVETVSIAERDEPLVLWKYAWAQERFDAQFIVRSALEPFALWRAHDHSFYLSDAPKPTALTSNGLSRKLREEVARQQDLHGVPGPRGRGFVDVRRRFPKMPVPIYRASARSRGVPGYYVETPGLCCWVLAGALSEAAIGRIDGLIDTVSYWLWQAADELGELGRRLTRHKLEVTVEVEDSPEWTAGVPARGPVVTVTARDVGTIALVAHAALLPRMARADNDGERELLCALLARLDEALPADQRVGWGEVDARAVVERVAPLGRKKMYLQWNPPPESAIDPRNLPPARPPFQEADDARALDELGEYLRRERRMPVGPIAEDERGGVVWEAVTFHLRRLMDLIATLSPDGLLEQLIAVHERFLERNAWSRHTLATREACYGDVVDLKVVLAEELPANAITGTALRFVIECVAAQPPSGIRPLSLEVQDRLVGLAAQVFGRGGVADALREGLEDMQLSILPSGRLGVSRQGRYQTGRERYVEHFVAGELRRANTFFAGKWEDRPPSGDAVADAALIERAAVYEWGAPYGEILEFFALLEEIADGEPAMVLPVDDAVARAAAELRWSETTARRVTDEFALRPRRAVLDPPAPFEKRRRVPVAVRSAAVVGPAAARDPAAERRR
jgi:hypothetical protein